MKLQLALIAGLFLTQALPAQAQEREWGLNTTDTQSYLVFAVPETDDVGLSFWCDFGKTEISAFLPVPGATFKKNEKVSIKIGVAGKVTPVAGTAELDKATGVYTVEGKFPMKSPLMQQLKKADQVSVTVLAHTATYPLDGADFDGMLAACNGASN